jgi:hypothetical protein
MAIILDGTNGINSSGVIVAPDGSASAPAITNDGDTNTGIFFPAADTIAFAEGGAEAMRIDSSGRVGIGTTAPAAPLEVLANSSNSLSLRVRANASNFGVLRFVSNDGNTIYSQFDSRSDGFLITNVANIPMVFATNDTERARISNAGDLTVSRQIGSRNGSGFGVFRASSTVTVANNATITLSGGSAAQIICVGCASSGTGAAFFANYNTTVSQIGGSATSISTSDSGTVDIAVYKSASDNTATFKNRSGSTKVYTIAMFCGENGGAN